MAHVHGGRVRVGDDMRGCVGREGAGEFGEWDAHDAWEVCGVGDRAARGVEEPRGAHAPDVGARQVGIGRGESDGGAELIGVGA